MMLRRIIEDTGPDQNCESYDVEKDYDFNIHSATVGHSETFSCLFIVEWDSESYEFIIHRKRGYNCLVQREGHCVCDGERRERERGGRGREGREEREEREKEGERLRTGEREKE
uniref:Uncharacterized protein n=1 Tax=Cacopsylla melanoneura TaxID=428564 RepID=A0A8D8PQU7_9HEMI